MTKKNEGEYLDLTTGLVVGGTGLVLGAGIVEKLPASGAKAGVQEGLSTAGGFISPMVNIIGAGIVVKQLKNLKEITTQDKKQSQGGFRL